MAETVIYIPDLPDLHWFNIPGLESKRADNNDYMLALQQISGLPLDMPLYIHMANGYLTPLEKIIHTPTDIMLMNSTGVHIYLYEPICSFKSSDINKPNPQNQGAQFYTDFHSDVDISTLRAVELESIKKYVENNSLTKVVVHTCDYGVDQYTCYSPYMTLLCDDILLKSFTVFALTRPNITSDFTKKFISTNWRYTNARAFIAAYLCTKSAHLSWSYVVRLDVILESLWFDLDTWQENCSNLHEKLMSNLSLLYEMSPVTLDRVRDEPSEITSASSYRYPEPEHFSPDNTNNSLEKYYRDAFVSIVTESRFAQPTANYSEKTYQAIINKKPFILVAPPKTLQYIREEGFRTFNDYWDESYDDCMNHEDRMIKIFDLIDYIDSKSIEELRSIYSDMNDIVEHNYKILLVKTPLQSAQPARK